MKRNAARLASPTVNAWHPLTMDQEPTNSASPVLAPRRMITPEPRYMIPYAIRKALTAVA